MSTAAIAVGNAAAPHPTPHWQTVLREQLRTVAMALRGQLILVGILLAIKTLMVVLDYVRKGAGFDADPTDLAIHVAVVGLLTPLSVWKGMEPARRSYFWAMPVDRTQHTLAKVFVGWAWLMALAAAYLLWALALAKLTGGDTGFYHMKSLRHSLPPGTPIVDNFPRGATWLWIVPFTGATAAYLVGSVLALLSDHSWRWIGGVAFGCFLYLVLLTITNLVTQPPRPGRLHHVFETVVLGRYGLESVVTGTSGPIVQLASGSAFSRSSGVASVVFGSLPNVAAWAVTTTLWTVAGLAGVVAVARRHRER